MMLGSPRFESGWRIKLNRLVPAGLFFLLMNLSGPFYFGTTESLFLLLGPAPGFGGCHRGRAHFLGHIIMTQKKHEETPEERKKRLKREADERYRKTHDKVLCLDGKYHYISR